MNDAQLLESSLDRDILEPAGQSTPQITWWRTLRAAALRDAHWFLPLFIVLAFAAYAHGWLCDDAFISFHYAANLTDGLGLVFNAGERVEGYTNFAWVLEIASLKKLFGLEPPAASVALSVIATLAYVLITLRLALTTPFRDKRRLVAWLACALLVINRNVAVWCSSGLETRQFSAFVLLGIYFAYQYRRSSKYLSYAALAFALAELTRPEAPLLWAACAIWYYYDARWHNEFRLRDALRFAVPFLAIVAAHYLFRRWYYGLWFPNTYYAKHVRAWPDAGLTYLTMLVTESGLYFILPVALLGLLWRVLRARDSLHLLSALIIAAHAAYLVHIGGDHFEFRPFDFYWPLLAVATADGIVTAGRIIHACARRFSAGARAGLESSAVAGLTLVLAVYSTVLQLVHDAITSDRRTRSETFGLNVQATLENAPIAYALPFMKDWILPVYNSASKFCIDHFIAMRWREHRLFWKELLELYGPYHGHVTGVFPKDAAMAIGTVGVIPYMLRGLTIIDTKGLTDKVVARFGRPPNRERIMAHDRNPPPGYLDERGVNIYVLPAATSLAEGFSLAPYVVRLDGELWMPFYSDKPAWVERAFRDKPLSSARLAPLLRDSSAMLNGRQLSADRWLADFERAPLDWRADGAAATDQPRGPITKQGAVAGALHRAFINTFHPLLGDQATGHLYSPEFLVPERRVLAFLIAGGSGPSARIELREGNRVITHWTGHDSEHFSPVLFDLGAFAGKQLNFAVIDESAEGWGHIMADGFMLLK